MLILKNITVNGRRTSLRMEPLMWDSLRDVAALKGITQAALVSQVEEQRGDLSTTAALRMFVLDYYRRALREIMEIQGDEPLSPPPLERRARQQREPMMSA